MNGNDLLLIFAASFTVCVLATPFVTRLARWAGAMDKPDNNRKVHTSTTPRMGGLALAAGLFAGMVVATLFQSNFGLEDASHPWGFRQGAILLASIVILAVGVLDDTQELRPRMKLAGQSMAVLIRYHAALNGSLAMMMEERTARLRKERMETNWKISSLRKSPK